jgi:hypothetical protein
MKRLLSLFAVVALLGGFVTWAAAAPRDDLQRAKSATARYHSIVQAQRAGYDPGPAPECVQSPAGVMGFHWENVPLMEDAVLDPARPEILLYTKKPNGKWELIGLEYYIEADQVTSRPSLFGQPFDGPFDAHHPGQETHYDLHVWVHKHNPSGLFAPFNPLVSCP